MTQEIIIDLMRGGLYTIVVTAAPPLLMGLIVGLAVSIFQTVTSIQEQTLAFVPKIVAVLVSLLLFGPFMLNNLTAFFEQLVTQLPDLITPR